MTKKTNTLPATRPKLAAGGAVRAIVPQDIEQAYRLATSITQADMAPSSYKREPNRVMLGIMAGMEVGMTPMVALQSIAIINNTPCIYGDGALGLVQGSGLLEDIDEQPIMNKENDEVIGFTCTVKRKDRASPTVRTFTMDDAQKAGLLKKQGPWKDYPQRMFQMRARSWALRDGFADVLKGLSIREEIMDMVPLEADESGTYAPAPPRPTRGDYKEDEATVDRATVIADAEGIPPDEALSRAKEEADDEASAGEADTVIENLTIHAPIEGDWRVKVEAALRACTTVDAVNALARDNEAGMADYAARYPGKEGSLKTLFENKLTELGQAPLGDGKQ